MVGRPAETPRGKQTCALSTTTEGDHTTTPLQVKLEAATSISKDKRSRRPGPGKNFHTLQVSRSKTQAGVHLKKMTDLSVLFARTELAIVKKIVTVVTRRTVETSNLTIAEARVIVERH